MSHVLATAAEVLGGVAILSTGLGLLGVPAIAGISTGALAKFAGIGAAAATIAAKELAKPARQAVNPMAWQSDPEAGIGYIMGRIYVGGQIVYRQAWGSHNDHETIITAYSAGPVSAFEQLYVDGVATSYVNGGQVAILDRGKMYASVQLGAQPEAKQLGDLGPPGWTSASKLSGLAASSITFVYDSRGDVTFTTEPQVGFVVRGVTAYDPRQDSTYPGGSGPQRATDETTWTYSENPVLHALSYLLGRRHNGKLVIGVGVALASILVPQYVEAANVADTNGWTISANISSTDNKWQRLKDILAAGGAEPLRLGAQIGCLVRMPRVSLATIDASEVVGAAKCQATQSRRDRLNAIVPRYMAEQRETLSVNGSLRTTVAWGMASASPVVVQDYVTFDGGQRQKQVDYGFVTKLLQAQQLARYDIEDSREFGPITLPLKLRWYGYRPGDVVTINHPQLGLNGQDVLILSRSLNPQACTVTITARSETYAKHAFALGQTGVAPPTPGVTGPPLLPTPGATAWAIVGEVISANGTTIPALVIAGSSDSPVADGIVFEYRPSVTGEDDAANWIAAGIEPAGTTGKAITGVEDGTAYQCAVSYKVGPNVGARLILGPVTAGQTSVPWSTGINGPDKPEDGATVGAIIGGNLKDGSGRIVFPADILNPEIDLTPDGRLTSTDVDGVVKQIGQLDLPEIDATVAAGQSQLVSDFAQLAATVIQLLAGQSNTTQIFRDAGLYIDPTTGTARLAAIDAQSNRLSQVQVLLDAVSAAISLKASQADLSAQGLRLTTAEQNISAATGTVSTAVSSIRQNSDQAGETGILAMLQGDAATRSLLTAYAAGRQDLTARLDGTDSAVAQLTLSLAVQIGALSAQVGTETTARIAGDTASATSLATYRAANDLAVGTISTNLGTVTQGLSTVAGYVTTLQGQVSDPNTGLINSVSNIQQTLATQNDLNHSTADSISSLTAKVGDANGGLTQNVATINQRLSAQADTNSSFAGSITQLTTATQNHSSTLTTYGQSIDGLESKWGVEIDNNGNITGIALNNQSGRTDFNIVADRFKYVDPNGGNAQTVFEYENGVLYMVAKLVAASIEAGMLDVNSAITPALWTLNSPVTGGGWDDGSGTTTGSGGGSSTGGSGSGGSGGKGGTAQP